MSDRPRRRLRPVLARAATAGAIALLPLLIGSSAHADTEPSLGGWNVSADGNVVDIVFDNATGLAGIHPFTEVDFPEANTEFETGPFGSALATVFWPGNAGGNFGSLSSELGLPTQLQPIAAKLNDPVKAATQYPAGPDTATYPAGAPGGAVVMQSSTTSTGSTAEGSLSDMTESSVLSFSSAKGSSSSTAAATATGTATSDLGGISLLGGLIQIGAVDSTATATSNGTTSSGSSVTNFGDVTLDGQKISISSNGGVNLPDFSSTLGPLVGPILQEALSEEIAALGINIKEFPSTVTQSGASYSVQSGGLEIDLTPPAGAASLAEQADPVLATILPSQAAIVATLPGLLQGASLDMTIGRATASAAASPAFDSTLPPPTSYPTTPGSTGTTGTTGTTPSSQGITVTPGTSGSISPSIAGSSGSPSPSIASAGSTPSGTTPSTGSLGIADTTPISLSSPLGAGMVLIGLIVAAGLGYGLFRVARMVLPADQGPACPLGRDVP